MPGFFQNVFVILQGRCLISVFLLTSVACALGMWRLVRRTKLCLDFACTVHFWHFLFCMIYSSSFPLSVAWWFTTTVSIILMTVLGEFLCMRSELKAIPLGGASVNTVWLPLASFPVKSFLVNSSYSAHYFKLFLIFTERDFDKYVDYDWCSHL